MISCLNLKCSEYNGKTLCTFSQLPPCWSFIFVSVIPLFPLVSKVDARQVCIHKCKFHSWAKILFVNIYSWLHSGSKCNVTQEREYCLLLRSWTFSTFAVQFKWGNGIPWQLEKWRHIYRLALAFSRVTDFSKLRQETNKLSSFCFVACCGRIGSLPVSQFKTTI